MMKFYNWKSPAMPLEYIAASKPARSTMAQNIVGYKSVPVSETKLKLVPTENKPNVTESVNLEKTEQICSQSFIVNNPEKRKSSDPPAVDEKKRKFGEPLDVTGFVSSLNIGNKSTVNININYKM